MHFLHADFYRVAMDRALTVDVHVVLKGEPKGVKQQGGVLDFVTREVEIECLPGDIPEHIEVDVSELMLNEGVRLRDVAKDVEMEARQRPRHAARPRHPAASGRGSAARRSRGRAATTPAEPEVIKKGKTDKDEDEEPEARRRPRQPGRTLPRYAAQRRLPRSPTSWPGAIASLSSLRPPRHSWRECGCGPTPVLLVKPLTMMNLSGEAVGALVRYYKVELGDLLVVADDVQLPLGRLRARRAWIGRRTQRAQVDHCSTSAPMPSRGCAWAWAGAMPDEIWPITCSRCSRG